MSAPDPAWIIDEVADEDLTTPGTGFQDCAGIVDEEAMDRVLLPDVDEEGETDG